MTVLSGRASSGVRSLLRVLVGGLFAAFGLLAGGCGNNTITYGTVVTTFSADNPAPFTAYIVDLYSFYLILNNGNTNYGFTGSVGAGKTVDFAQLADKTELFGPLAVPEGTYTTATITLNYAQLTTSNYFAAQLFVDINGTSYAATQYDPTSTTSPPAAPGTISYTIKFDPAHPLVVQRGTPTRLDFHFDTSASSTIVTNPTASPPTATVYVRPFLTASTVPVITKPLRARGEFVAADTANNNFTMNMRSFFDAPSYTTTAQGAVHVQVTDQTTYNVNGVPSQGAIGLKAVAGLPQITTIVAYGTLGDITGQDPILNATEVYAGIAVEDTAATEATGTVVSRSGDTLHLHNASLIHPPGYLSTSSNVVEFLNDLTLTINDSTTSVLIDRQPTATSSTQSISIGQQVDLQSPNAYTAGSAALDATGGLMRLTTTPAWGTLDSATPGSATVNLLTLGAAQPAVIQFTGTGATTPADPTHYVIGTGSVDLSAYATNSPLFRFDGLVSPFGSAAPAAGTPDFTADTVTAGTSNGSAFGTRAEQVLTIEWAVGAGTGITQPFTSLSSVSGLVPTMTSLGATHLVQTGPASIDLTNPAVTPTIVPDPNLTGQFSVGNGQTGTTTGISVYHSFADFVNQINNVNINGTNTFVKVVAVGKYDETSHIFTAYRIDLVQLP